MNTPTTDIGIKVDGGFVTLSQGGFDNANQLLSGLRECAAKYGVTLPPSTPDIQQSDDADDGALRNMLIGGGIGAAAAAAAAIVGALAWHVCNRSHKPVGETHSPLHESLDSQQGGIRLS
jgi:hypothetical protein